MKRHYNDFYNRDGIIYDMELSGKFYASRRVTQAIIAMVDTLSTDWGYRAIAYGKKVNFRFSNPESMAALRPVIENEALFEKIAIS
jgi:hypothetical protein